MITVGFPGRGVAFQVRSPWPAHQQQPAPDSRVGHRPV